MAEPARAGGRGLRWVSPWRREAGGGSRMASLGGGRTHLAGGEARLRQAHAHAHGADHRRPPSRRGVVCGREGGRRGGAEGPASRGRADRASGGGCARSRLSRRRRRRPLSGSRSSARRPRHLARRPSSASERSLGLGRRGRPEKEAGEVAAILCVSCARSAGWLACLLEGGRTAWAGSRRLSRLGGWPSRGRRRETVKKGRDRPVTSCRSSSHPTITHSHAYTPSHPLSHLRAPHVQVQGHRHRPRHDLLVRRRLAGRSPPSLHSVPCPGSRGSPFPSRPAPLRTLERPRRDHRQRPGCVRPELSPPSPLEREPVLTHTSNRLSSTFPHPHRQVTARRPRTSPSPTPSA